MSANMCDWILMAKCVSLDDAYDLAELLKELPCQMTGISEPVIEESDSPSRGACLTTDGECEWGLYGAGSMKERLVELSKGGRTIEVFSDYATKFNKAGDVTSDTYQEHLVVRNGEISLYSFRSRIPRYGEFSI